MPMWLAQEGKYACFSFKTRNKSTAIDKVEFHGENFVDSAHGRASKIFGFVR